MARAALDPVAALARADLSRLTQAEKERIRDLLRRRALIQGVPALPDPWPTDIEAFLKDIAPHIASKPMGPHHLEFWDHLSNVVPGVRPQPLAFIVNRGGAKSASAEMACVVLGGLKRRKYIVYISAVQELADDHVGTIAGLLESPAVAAVFPGMAVRRMGRYGPKAWRRNRLQTASGYIIDAVGLDVSTRGRRIEEQRPDGAVLDDFDSVHDSPGVVQKKLRTITGSILPMGSPDLMVIVAQNLIYENSIAMRIAYPDRFEEDQHLLINRHLIGPIPAVYGLETKAGEPKADGSMPLRIIAGTPSWEGLPLEACEAVLNESGPLVFAREYQHDTKPPPGGSFSHIVFRHIDPSEVPWERIVDGVVAVDPATTSSDQSDAVGISVSSVDSEGFIYRHYSFERICSPSEAIEHAVLRCHEYKFGTLIIEDNQGGDTWKDTFARAIEKLQGTVDEDGNPAPKIPVGWKPRLVFARVGSQQTKKARAEAMEPDYARGDIIHVRGTHEVLESALWRFPLTSPDDLVDSAVHGWKYLRRLRKAPSLTSTGPTGKSDWVTPGGGGLSVNSSGGWSLDGGATRDGAFSWRLGS